MSVQAKSNQIIRLGLTAPMDGIGLCSVEINGTVSHISSSGTKRTIELNALVEGINGN